MNQSTKNKLESLLGICICGTSPVFWVYTIVKFTIGAHRDIRKLIKNRKG